MRKYAALVLALGVARGALSETLAGNLDDAQRIMDVTATSRIAAALGWTESDLAIDWSEHLTRQAERSAGLGEPDAADAAGSETNAARGV